MTFEQFVGARLGAILRYATVVTWDRDLAEDITQDVMARAQLRWGHIGGLDAPEMYVKRMVLNRFLSWRRHAVRSVALSRDRIEAVTAPVPDTSDRTGERDAMMRLIADLPVKQRTVVALRFYEDLAIEQIADLMGSRPTTVRTHLARALVTLRASLPAGLSTMSGGQ